MADPGEVVRQIYVRTEPAAYRGLFFNTPWTIAISSRLHGTPFERPLDELLFEWRLTVSAFQFPYMTVESVATLSGGDGFSEKPEDSPIRSEAWEYYFGRRTFALGVSGLMRQTYAALMFAYEHFLLKCYRLKSGNISARTSDGDFSKNFSSTMPNTIQHCWSQGEIGRARKVRNSIAHAGAEAGNVPRANGFTVVGGILQITPGDVEKLMGHLQKAVDRLCDSVLS